MDPIATYCQVFPLPENLLGYIDVNFAGDQVRANEFTAPDGNQIKFTVRFNRADLEEMERLRDGLNHYIKAWGGNNCA